MSTQMHHEAPAAAPDSDATLASLLAIVADAGVTRAETDPTGLYWIARKRIAEGDDGSALDAALAMSVVARPFGDPAAELEARIVMSRARRDVAELLAIVAELGTIGQAPHRAEARIYAAELVDDEDLAADWLDEAEGLVRRDPDPDDRRAAFAMRCSQRAST